MKKNSRSEESKKQQKKHDEITYKKVTFRLNKILDVELINFINSQSNKNEFIKQSLKNAMNNQKI